MSISRTLTTTAATVSTLDDDDENSPLIRKQTTNDALRRETARSTASVDEDDTPLPSPDRNFNLLTAMGNKPSQRLEYNFTQEEVETLRRKRGELKFIPGQDVDQFLNACWNSSQYLRINGDWNLSAFLETLKLPEEVMQYIKVQNCEISSHPLMKKLLKEFWNYVLKGIPMRKFSPSNTLLSNAGKFILEVEGSLQNPRWTLVYTTMKNGKSWNSFIQSLALSEESVLVIKDKDGFIFGGYKPSPFLPSPNFRNEPNSFLFSLNPVKLYKPSGINDHHTYYNQGSKSGFPNGIGFGGQLEYFGVYIDKDFEHGHSRANPSSTTFSSPKLSGKEDFEIEEVEVWMIRERDVDSIEYKKSVLEGNSEIKALLEMSGKQIYSEGLRGPPAQSPPEL